MSTRRTILQALGCAFAIPAFANKRFRANENVQAANGSQAPALAWKLADYIQRVKFEDLSSASVARAKEQLIYHVGLAFSGALTEAGRAAVGIVRQFGSNNGPSTIIGQAVRATPLDAAFANSTFMRALGLDDVVFPSGVHAGLLTLPVALAVAESRRCSGKELLTAVVTGYEVLGKMVLEETPARVSRRPSMPFGAFAGVTVAARLLRLSTEQTAFAIGYAADSAMGLKEGNEQQPTHIYGLIARNALTAAIVAGGGGQTSRTILEGQFGFYQTLIGRVPDSDQLVARLGDDPEILRATQKRFPGTAMNIIPVQLMLALVSEYDLSASRVANVEFELPEDRRSFADSISTGPFLSRTQAESSVAFQAAIILLDGRIDLARYDQLQNPEILDVIKKVSIVLIPHENTRFARVRITTKKGTGRNAPRVGAQISSTGFAELARTRWRKVC